jgi:hypothetical protein
MQRFRLPEPSAPVRTPNVADVCDRRAAELRRAGHSPARHDKLALALDSDANDRRHLVGEDRGEQREVAGAVVRRAKPIADRGLAFGQAVEVAHGGEALRYRSARCDGRRLENQIGAAIAAPRGDTRNCVN